MSYRDITVKNLFTDKWIAAGTTVTSEPIDIGAYAANGYFSLELFVEGSGTSICAAYSLANNGKDFILPSAGSAITASTATTAFHHRSGVAKNGWDIVAFEPIMAARMKIVLWEAIGTTGSTVTARLAVH